MCDSDFCNGPKVLRRVKSHSFFKPKFSNTNNITTNKMSYTIPQFETALLAIEVQIEEIKTPGNKVSQVIGYKDGIRLTWNENGECFRNKVSIPKYNLKF